MDIGTLLAAAVALLTLVLHGRVVRRAAVLQRRTDERQIALLQNASDFLVVLDAAGQVSFVGPTVTRAFRLARGAGLDELVAVIHPDDQRGVSEAATTWLGEPSSELFLTLRAHDYLGALHHLDVRARDLRQDRAVGGVVLTCRDVTDRKTVEEHLSHQVRHDGLTGLASKSAVFERLELSLDDPDAMPVCVFFIGLDRFQLVNDSHGYGVGDQVLTLLARRLRDTMRPSDLVGRFGGDELVVVTDRVDGVAQGMQLANRVLDVLAEPITLGRRELFVTASIGVCLGDLGEAPETVLRNADTAMARAKAAGRNCVMAFEDAMRVDSQRLLRTENDLHRALERDQLVLHFQPVLCLTGDGLDRVEALVRWEHPTLGLVQPDDFICVAEETGLIVPIGAWVLEQACRWAAEAADLGGTPVQVAVNVSARQLSEPGVVELVDRVLRETGLSPHLLCLEVTETMLVDDAEVAGLVLTALSARGVRLSIDDFGTGWSSLTYLQRFPVDEIKLDRSYVSGVGVDPSASAIVAALVTMAHTMGLSVVAEGVETDDQLRFLRAQECDAVQGYLFCRPVPGPDARQLLAAGARAGHLSLVEAVGPAA